MVKFMTEEDLAHTRVHAVEKIIDAYTDRLRAEYRAERAELEAKIAASDHNILNLRASMNGLKDLIQKDREDHKAEFTEIRSAIDRLLRISYVGGALLTGGIFVLTYFKPIVLGWVG